MKVEELIGRTVWIKSDQFRSVPGKIQSVSIAVNLDDIKLSASQSNVQDRDAFSTGNRDPRFRYRKD
jgi:hypothetical protein